MKRAALFERISVWVGTYGIALVLLGFYVSVVQHFDCTPDDTYIYLQYSKNLVNGDGLSFNAGHSSYGFTGPLWLGLISLGTEMHLSPLLVAKVFDLVFASLSILLLYAIVRRELENGLYAFFAALLFSVDAWFLRWSATGMESSLAVLLTLLVFNEIVKGDFLIGSFVTGCLTLVRPEGVLLAFVLFVYQWFHQRSPRSVLESMLTFAATTIPWFVFAKIYFGTFLSNTFLAKSAFDVRSILDSAVQIVLILGASQAVVILLAIATGVVFVRRSPRFEFEPWIVGGLWAFILVCGYAFLGVQVVSRYLVPVVPMIALASVWGVKGLREKGILAPRTAIILLALVSLVSVIQNQWIYRSRLEPHTERFARGMTTAVLPIGEWLRDHSADTATVVVNDVGLIGYISDRQVCDPAGLIEPKLRRVFQTIGYDSGMVHRAYEQVVHPDFVVDRAAQKERLRSAALQPILTTSFPGLGVSKPDTIFFTLYRTVR